MAAGIGLQLAVSNYTLNACKVLTSCKVPEDVEKVLRSLLLLVRLSKDHNHVDSTSRTPAPDSSLELSYARVLHEAQSTEQATHVMEALLFQQMESITFSLLPVAAISASKSKALVSLLHELFQAAPAAAALQALISYIGSVTPTLEEEVATLRPRTQALGTDLAACMLAQRFATPGSSGIQQLCKEISTAQALKAMPGVLPHHRTLAETMPDQIAAALVSVVDRSSQCSQQILTPQAFIPHVVHQFVSTASASSLASHTASDCSSTGTPTPQTDSAELAVDRRGVAFMGDVCGRFCRRGYASIVAETCWQRLLELHQSVQSPHTDSLCHNHHHQNPHQQQQQEPTSEKVQQQQQQHLPLPDTTNNPALAPSSEQVSSGMISHHAARCIIHAVQEPTAVEKLLSSLLQSASSDLQHLDRNVALLRTVIQPLWAQDTVRLLLCNKLLLHSTQPLPSLILSMQLLDMLPPQQPELGAVTQTHSTLIGVASTMAEVWSDKGFCTRVDLKQQAYITCALAICIAKSGKGCLERTQGLLPAVLQGVSTRLDNPVDAIRRQGMRVGNTFSRALDPTKPLLFGDFPLEILEEEVWHPSAGRLAWQDPVTGLTSDLSPEQTSATASAKPAADFSTDGPTSGNQTHEKAKSTGSPGQAHSWGSDHESDSDDSLQPFDLAEEDDDGLDSGDRPMQLRDIVAALRKSEDVYDKLRALKNLEGALLAAPDELKHHAGELARALLHVRAPDWADEEARRPEDKPQVRRYRSMVALLVSTPEVAGAAFTSELYSAHLDVHQRMLILETLASAAQQMANPRARLQAGADLMPGLRGSLESGSEAVTNATQGSKQVGRTRRWGTKSLQKQQQQQQCVDRVTSRNAFPGVALPWAAALLQECDVERHGVDLFSRDPLLLGRLLITLGTFVECVGSAPVAAQLAACVLELIRSPGVHGHPQPYVRRSALLASAQVVATLSPARLAGAMTGATQPGSIDSVLMEQLQWLQSWAADTASTDVDVQCQQFASACANLQAGLAAKALESLEAGPQSVQQSLQGLPNMQSPAMLIDAVQLGTLSL